MKLKQENRLVIKIILNNVVRQGEMEIHDGHNV